MTFDIEESVYLLMQIHFINYDQCINQEFLIIHKSGILFLL